MEWSARVEWSTPEPYGLDDVDDLVAALEQHHVAIGGEKVPEHVDETWAATISYDAEDLRAAVNRALEIVEAATGLPAAGVEVLVTEIRDHRFDLPEGWGERE